MNERNVRSYLNNCRYALARMQSNVDKDTTCYLIDSASHSYVRFADTFERAMQDCIKGGLLALCSLGMDVYNLSVSYEEMIAFVDSIDTRYTIHIRDMIAEMPSAEETLSPKERISFLERLKRWFMEISEDAYVKRCVKYGYAVNEADAEESLRNDLQAFQILYNSVLTDPLPPTARYRDPLLQELGKVHRRSFFSLQRIIGLRDGLFYMSDALEVSMNYIYYFNPYLFASPMPFCKKFDEGIEEMSKKEFLEAMEQLLQWIHTAYTIQPIANFVTDAVTESLQEIFRERNAAKEQCHS